MSKGSRAGWLMVLLAACIPAGAQIPREYVLDIPRVPRDVALRELALQTRIHIGTLQPSEQIVGPLKGSYTIEMALTRLLAGSGFKFARVNDNTFDVWEDVPAIGVSTGVQSHPKERTPAQSPPRSDPQLPLWEETIVTGSRMQVGSVEVFNAEATSQLGGSSVPDLLKYLPQQPYAYPGGYDPGGRQYADLRGLGATLVLINGRWVAPTAGSMGYTFDLNSIPLSAIERVDVLDSAASVFGANAIGGVVNIVLKSDIQDPTIEISYGTAQGGAEERRASLSTGYSHATLHASLVLDYFARDFLQGAQRALWRDQDYRRYGSYDWRASDGNISSLIGDLPGLGSRFAAVPVDGASEPEDFAAGVRNVISEYRFVSIVPAATRTSAVASAELKLPGADAFGELFYSDRDTAFQYGPPRVSGVLVPRTNPFNPFGVPVVSDFLLKGVAPRRTMTQMSLVRSVVGLRGKLGSWHWEFSALRSEEDGAVWTTNQLDIVRLAAALASSDPTQALNVFQDGPGGSPELLASLVHESVVGRYSSAGSEAAGSMSGPLFALPAGDVAAVIGGQWRRESMLFDERALSSLSRIVSAAFVEMQLPLTRTSRLLLGGRFDRYSDWGYGFNAQYGFVWDPVALLRVRVSYGTGFRPPSMYELAGPRMSMPGQVPDSRRHNEVASLFVRTGGNPQLAPTVASTWIAGATWSPESLSDLQLSLDYWRIRMDERIRVIPVSELLADEDFYEARVVRANPTPADLAAGLPGVLQYIDMAPANAGRLETSGVDVSLSDAIDTDIGRFTTRLSATWVDKFDTTDSPGLPERHRTGVASPLGTIAKWRAVASLEWRDRWTSLSTEVRYVAAYDDVNSFGRNGRVVPAQATVDLHASLDLGGILDGGGWLRDLQITAGLLNAFDRPPPFAEVGSVAGYDLSQGDLRQRFGYLRLSKKF